MATPKLLLADASVTIQRMVDQTFANENIDVVTVGDGETAIVRIRAERPDVILADVVLPKRNGYEVAAFVKSQSDLAHIPVILLAGAFEPVDQARARQMGCNGVLVKPFKPQQVISRVREVLRNAKGGLGQSAVSDVLRAVARPVGGDPAALRPTPAADSHFDDYFDRLDSALAPGSRKMRRVVEDEDGMSGAAPEDLNLPTLDALLAGDELRLGRPVHVPDTPAPPVEPPVHIISSSVTPSFVHGAAPAPPHPIMPVARDQDDAAQSPRSLIADAFVALLAVELGEPGALPVRLTSSLEGPAITDAVIDGVTERVLERLAADSENAVRDAVARIVSDVTERLVREEIRRIKDARR